MYHLSVKQIGSKSGLTYCLIWVKTVCKGYQQTTLGGKALRKIHVYWEDYKRASS